MVYTNHRLTILDDEAIIASIANDPVHVTLAHFLGGTGQHEHPPLSDIVLHAWLLLTQRSLAWLRVSANLLFILGIYILAKCGQLLGGRRTAWAILLLATLWPFGYFYARIAGWYCFCFLIVSLLIYCYFRLLRDASLWNWIAFTCSSILLVWSNYYGIVILLVLLLDMLVLQMALVRKHILALFIACCSIILSFLPLLRALLSDAGGTVKSQSLTWTTSIVKICFMLYANVASIAVAPWFLPWSVPCGIAVLALYGLLVANPVSRRAAIHYLILIIGLAITNHLDLKRLLFLTPWLLLAMARLISSTSRIPAIAGLAVTAIAFSIGWLGIATGRHLTISNFYEPWQSVARSTSAGSHADTAIITDSGLFLFYLNSTLAHDTVPDHLYTSSEAYRERYHLFVYTTSLPPGTTPGTFTTITTVRGATPGAQTDEEMQKTVVDLSHQCHLDASQRYWPDPAAAYKRRFEPASPTLDYRISVDRFDCSSSPRPPNAQPIS